MASNILLQAPLPQTTILGGQTITGSFALKIPLPVFAIIGGNTSNMVLSMPFFKTALTGNPAAYNSIILSTPLFKTSIAALSGRIGDIALSIPLPEVAILSHAGSTGDIALSIPVLKTVLTGLSGRIGGISLELPSFITSLTGYRLQKGNFAFVLPLFRTILEGQESRAVTPTGIPLRFGYAMNLVNWGVTEYRDYPFNSFVCFNGKQLGFNELGMYDLEGNTDDGVPIYAWFQTGTEDLWRGAIKRLKEAWVTSRQKNGGLNLTLILDEKQELTLTLNSEKETMHEERIKLPKGLKNRFVGFKVSNIQGSDFDWESMRVFLNILTRAR